MATLNKYGIEVGLWKMLPPEDQNRIINEYYGRTVVPEIGGYAPGAVTAPPPPPRETQAAPPPQVVWIFVRWLNSFPGNHPDYGDLRAHGVNGVLFEIDDPYLPLGVQTARDANFHVGVWSDPHGQDPATFGARLKAAADATGAELGVVDSEVKGFPGTPGWEYEAALAAAVRAANPNLPLAASPPVLTGFPTDYNFGAYVAQGISIWMQIYGSENEPIATPQETYDLLLRNGVPPEMATVILAAGSLDVTATQAQTANLPYWAIWTADDITGTDRSVPFGDNSGSADSTPYDPTSEDLAIFVGDTSDDSGAGGGEDTSDEYALALVAADEGGYLDEFLSADSGGLQFESVPGTYGGKVHDTLGWAGYPAIDFFAKPGTIVVSPFYGVIRRFSGHNPSIGWAEGAGGPFGWSIYLRASEGYDFFITHLGTRLVQERQIVVPGQAIGTVGNIPHPTPPHTHIGVWDGTAHNPGIVRSAGGLVINPKPWQPNNMRRLQWFDRTPGSTGPPGPKPGTSKPVDFDVVNGAWLKLMHAKDVQQHTMARSIRASGDRLMGIVK